MALIAAFVALAIGLLLIGVGRSIRGRRGLAQARTVALDDRTLYSARYGLVGRPDRIVVERGIPIPEEWKSSTRVYDSHRAQLGVYFLLIEEQYRIQPPHGYIVTGTGHRVRIDNTPELRAWVLDVAARIRTARSETDRPIPVNQPAAKCRVCGMREVCGQRSDP